MPIKRTAYACEFKCGRQVLVSRKAMEKHEARCFWNPDRRACKTCGNHEFEEGDPSDHATGYYYRGYEGCAADAMEFIGDRSAGTGILRADCEAWKPKDGAADA